MASDILDIQPRELKFLFTRLITQSRYSDCGQTFRGEQCGGRFIRKAVKDENTVSINKEFLEGHTTTGYEDKDEYEYKKTRNHGFCGGYLTNGEVLVEGGFKKIIFDRRNYTGYKATEMYMDDVNRYEMKFDSDSDLEYEDFADADELFIVTEDNRKSFGDNSPH